MVGVTAFEFSNLNYSVKTLEISDADILQQLYEKCADYSHIIEGRPPSPTAAIEEFTAVPEGRSLHDKYMLGIFNSQDELIGLLEGMQNYPEDKDWWIGVIMLAPAYRRKGLLNPLLEEFEQYIAQQGMNYVMGSVAKVNSKVLRLWQQMGFKIVRQVERESNNARLRSWSIIRRKVGYSNN